jgi:hypothetical protein
MSRVERELFQQKTSSQATCRSRDDTNRKARRFPPETSERRRPTLVSVFPNCNMSGHPKLIRHAAPERRALYRVEAAGNDCG